MATAAAPTFLKPHMTESAVELVDGGVWANNPIGVAAIEAIGMLGWPGRQAQNPVDRDDQRTRAGCPD